MARHLSLFFLIFLCCSCSYKLSSYRVQMGDPVIVPSTGTFQNVTFLRPPGSRLTILKSGVIAAERRYQLITVHKLDNDYQHCLVQISKACYGTSGVSPKFAGEPEAKSYWDGAIVLYLKDHELQIAIDYNQLWIKPDMVSVFNCLGGKLIAALADKLQAGGVPPTVAQSLVNKVFELIPYPVRSSAGRYGYSDNGTNFMLMFDEDLRLEMDGISQSNDGVHSVYFGITGQYPFEFRRGDDGNISQNPLMGSARPTAPPNSFVHTNTYLIASFADLQNSAVLRDDPFVVIYSPVMKRNNGDSRSVPYAPTDDPDPVTGNFMLLSLQQPAMSAFDFTATRADAFDNYTRSVFGLRNQGKVVFDIWVNKQQRTVALGQRVGDLLDLPANIAVYRKQGGVFRSVSGHLAELILLPGDQITFDL